MLKLRISILAEPIEQIVQLMRDHFYNHCRIRSERSAVIEFRKRVSWYAKNLHPCEQLRQEMRLFNDAAEFEAILARFLEWRQERGAIAQREDALQPA